MPPKSFGNGVRCMTVKPSLAIPTALFFGPGRAVELPGIARAYGRTVLVVTGPGALSDLAGALTQKLETEGFKAASAAVVDREPTLAIVDRVIAEARAHGAEVLVGLGGGSCLDAAKAAAIVLPTGRPAADFFGGAALPGPGLPWIAMPTTAGSGAEATANAVLIDQETRIKQSIRSGHMHARAAVIDPLLTEGLPPKQTAYSGLDALSHAVESFCSRGANELTDVIALEAARLILLYLQRAYTDGGDREARAALAKASLLAGIALANARLGAVHGLAHPIGSLYNQPHGLICGVLLPQIMRFNLRVCHEKYARLAEIWGAAGGGDVFDRAAAAIRHVMALNRRLGIPAALGDLGLSAKDFPEIVRQAALSPSLAANPRPVSQEDLMAILGENIQGT